MKVIFENIRNLFEESAETQKEIADKINISSHKITDWKKERYLPTYEDIIKLSKYFKVSTDEILGNEKLESINRYPKKQILNPMRVTITETKEKTIIEIEK